MTTWYIRGEIFGQYVDILMMPTPSYNLIVCLATTTELCMAGGNPIPYPVGGGGGEPYTSPKGQPSFPPSDQKD